MTRAAPVAAVILLVAGCGGSTLAQTNAQTATTRLGKVIQTRCTSVSGGFRACTVFRLRGEVSRIERRHRSRWSVLLAADRAPYPGKGWWERVFAGPQGRTLLAEWSGECEIPFTYLIATDALALRRVFRPQAVTPVGWTSDGFARVHLEKPIHASKTRIARPSGIYLLTQEGDVARLERRVPPSLGC